MSGKAPGRCCAGGSRGACSDAWPDPVEAAQAANLEWANARFGPESDLPGRADEPQRPSMLWFGCVDSRVPIERLAGLGIGDALVHRTIANRVASDDPASSATLEFGLGVLGIREVVVCGHDRCGGLAAALGEPGAVPEAVETWIEPLRALVERHRETLDAIAEPDVRLRRLVELNVLDQVEAVRRSAVHRRLEQAGDAPRVHGWVYDIATGRLRDAAESPSA